MYLCKIFIKKIAESTPHFATYFLILFVIYFEDHLILVYTELPHFSFFFFLDM